MPKVTEKYLIDKKAFILECTAEILKEKPLYLITMKDIIKKAGFSHGVIYRYYANIDEIYVDFINKNTTYNLLEQRIEQLIASDRFDRHKLMVGIDFTNGVVVLVFISMLMLGNPSVFSVGVVMVSLSIISAMESPLSMACIPLLVEENKLEQANGLVSGIGAVSQIVAPVLGGILYGILSLKTLVVFSCIAFFLASLMESFIQIPFVKREVQGGLLPTLVSDMKEGFTYVIREPFIRKAIVLAALLNLFLSPLLIVGTPIILRVTMRSTDRMYGVGMGLINLATVLGALAVGWFSKKLRMNTVYRWIVAAAVLLAPVILAVLPYTLRLGYHPSFAILMAGIVPIAMILTLLSIFVISKVQKKTPNENLGKVMAIVMAVAQCAAPIGQILYGSVLEIFQANIYLPILVISVILLLVACVAQRGLKNEPETN